MHKLFFCCTNFLNTPRGPSRQNCRDIPDSSLRNPRKTDFWRRARTCRPPPLHVEDPPPLYTRNWYHLSFWRFFHCFTVFVASKLAIFPLKRSVMVMGAWKGPFRGRKGQMVDLGFRHPKTTWNGYKTRENVITPQLASLHGLASNWAKNCYKTGEKRQKDKWYPFRAPTPPPTGRSPDP